MFWVCSLAEVAMLTRKQHELLMFINQRLAATGVAPSFDEMKDALNLRSKSGIHRLISGLEERGFIRRLPHRARALEVTRLPESLNTKVSDAVQKTVTGVKTASQKISESMGRTIKAMADGIVPLPMLGRIAAGTAIEAISSGPGTVEVPSMLVGRGEHYVLEVAGDSMVEAGIFDGDSVIIQRCDAVDNGEVAVALIDGQEVTLKS